jgi:hypothetical protein
MFSRNFFILVLFIGQLLSSDKKSESKSQYGLNNFENKVLFSLGVGIAGAVISHKTVFLDAGNAKQLCYLKGFCAFDNHFSIITANLKLIPFFVVNKRLISLVNGQRLCSVFSVVHGCFAAVACQRGLNRFFPS